MTICPLADRPAVIPLLASWFHSEWSSIDGRSTDGNRSSFNTHSLFRGRDSAIAVPLTYGVVTLPDGQRVCEGSVTCPLLYEGPPGGVHAGPHPGPRRARRSG